MWRLVLMCCVVMVNIGNSVSFLKNKRQTNVTLENNILEIFNNCFCVYHYQCDNDGVIITNGERLFEERVGNEFIRCHGGKFEGEILCCRLNSTEDTREPRNPDQNITTEAPHKKPRQQHCGKQLPAINIRAFSGHEASSVNGEFPWLINIFKKKQNDWKYLCVGTLIHPRVVLTVHHYLISSKADDLRVIANSEIQMRQVGENEAFERGVEEIVKNPKYYSGGLYNDVAIIILKENYDILHIQYAINTICLKIDLPFENQNCIVLGWEKSPESKRLMLKKIELPVVGRSKCEELLRKTRVGADFTLHESHICAGGELGKDVCTGNGGSPLMCPTDNGSMLFQVGMVSWGVDCGKENVPGIYANIKHSYDWIVQELSKRNITLSDITMADIVPVN